LDRTLASIFLSLLFLETMESLARAKFWASALSVCGGEMCACMHARARARACPILNNVLKFLKNYGRYGKMFQTKVVWFREEHKKVPLIWPWVASLESDQGHVDFFKW